jgi:hypothetical protein
MFVSNQANKSVVSNRPIFTPNRSSCYINISCFFINHQRFFYSPNLWWNSLHIVNYYLFKYRETLKSSLHSFSIEYRREALRHLAGKTSWFRLSAWSPGSYNMILFADCVSTNISYTFLCSYIYVHTILTQVTADGGTVVKVLYYKSEGRWYDSRWCHWNFSLI